MSAFGEPVLWSVTSANDVPQFNLFDVGLANDRLNNDPLRRQVELPISATHQQVDAWRDTIEAYLAVVAEVNQYPRVRPTVRWNTLQGASS